MAVNYALDPVLEVRFAEVNEKIQLQAAESQLRPDLLRVHGKQCFHRFEFGNNFSIHHEV